MLLYILSLCFIQRCLDKNLKVIYGNNLHKKKRSFSESHFTWTQTSFLPLLHAAGPPLSGPWYWQGWHQRRALTLGELGLPAVSNQVYFEVRDTRTPRAKAATSPPPLIPHPTKPATSEPPGTTDTQHSCIGSRCCRAAVRALYLRGPRKWWQTFTEDGNAASNNDTKGCV